MNRIRTFVSAHQQAAVVIILLAMVAAGLITTKPWIRPLTHSSTTPSASSSVLPYHYTPQGDTGTLTIDVAALGDHSPYSPALLNTALGHPSRWAQGLWRTSNPADAVQSYAQAAVLGARSVSIRKDSAAPATTGSTVTVTCRPDGTATVTNPIGKEQWQITQNAAMTADIDRESQCWQAADLVSAMHGVTENSTPFDTAQADGLLNQHPDATEWNNPYATPLPSHVLAVTSDDYKNLADGIASGKVTSSDLGHGFAMVTSNGTKEGHTLTGDQVSRIVDARLITAKKLIDGCRDD